MKNKVYIVTSGNYSDFRIEAVFSTEEKAKEYIDSFAIRQYEYDIYEYDIDEYFNNRIREYAVCIRYDDAYITRIEEKTWATFPNPSNSINGNIIGATKIVNMVFSTDKIDAIKKIATERLMQIKALEQIKFPYLFRRVVLGSYPTLSNISEDRRNKHYPIYDFNTGHIWLEEGQDLKTGIKATTKIIER